MLSFLIVFLLAFAGHSLQAQENEIHWYKNLDEAVEEARQNDRPMMIDFWADWCGPCHAVAPTLEELEKTFSGRATIAKLDADQNPQASARYGIRSIPTLILFKAGREQERLLGEKLDLFRRELLAEIRASKN